MSWLKILGKVIDLIADTGGNHEPIIQADEHDGGGYLGYYGLRDWYDSQPRGIQRFLYKSCGYGINTCSRNLTHGTFISIGSPDDEYPWTATKFLCNHSITALHERNHTAFHALIDKARDCISSAADREYYVAIKSRTTAELAIYPDQKEINRVKPIIRRTITKNPGILQSDLKNGFSPNKKNIYEIAYSQILREGKVRREKAGRSFRLFLDETSK